MPPKKPCIMVKKEKKRGHYFSALMFKTAIICLNLFVFIFLHHILFLSEYNKSHYFLLLNHHLLQMLPKYKAIITSYSTVTLSN